MDGRPIRPGRFYANRALRILPMSFVAVALGGLYHRDAVTALPALVFWNIGIATLFPFGAVWWSLVPEVQFYAVLPGLHALWRSQLLRWLLLPVAVFACVAYAWIAQPGEQAMRFIAVPENSLLARWPAFACGAALAALHARHGERLVARRAGARAGGAVAADIASIALWLLLGVLLREDARSGVAEVHLNHFHRLAVQAVAWTAILAAGLYLPGRVSALLAHRALVRVGVISYSLYLLHDPVIILGGARLREISWVASHLSPAGILAVCIAGSLALSEIAYRWIEQPMLAWKAR